MRILTAFVSKLCAHQSLTPQEAQVITTRIGLGDTVILSAYKVAEWTQSADYFQRMLSVICRSLRAGGEEHERKGVLIDIANVLHYDSEEIGEEVRERECLYL